MGRNRTGYLVSVRRFSTTNHGSAGPRPGAGGFTLLEVIVALAVAAVTLAGLMKAASENVTNTARLRDKTLAHWVAMNKATELRVTDQWPSPGTQTGSTDMAERKWYWQIETSNTEDPYVRRLEIEVSDDENGDGSLVVLTGFLHRP